MADVKRSLDIEAALRWAYRDELPKTAVRMAALETPDFLAKPGDGWGAIENYAELLTRVDANRYGVVPNLLDLGEPHPDALLIGEAVKDLDSYQLEFPDDWNPLADMGDLGQPGRACIDEAITRDTVLSATGHRRLRTSASVLVTKYAILGRGLCPEWECDVPELKAVSHPNGVPRWFVKRTNWTKGFGDRDIAHDVEEDGFNAKARRPYGDAYRKFFLSPDPSLAILGRAEFETWHFALSVLTETLAPTLSSIALTPFGRCFQPWMQQDLAPATAPSLSELQAPLSEFGASPQKMRRAA